jgi:hypothetical protein
MLSSLAPREIRHHCSHFGWHHSRTRPGVDPRAHESRDPLHQPLPPRRHECLRDVVVAHMPPRSAVAPPQPLPRHCRAHLKGSLPRAPQGDTVALEPHGIRRRDRCHITVVRTSWGRRRMRALGIRCPSRSHLAVVRDPPSRRRSRSHVTVVRTSRGRCRVHLRETLSRSSPTGSAAATAATSPSCAPHGAAAACVPSGSDAPAAPTSPSCVPQGSAAASVSPRSAVARLLPGSAVARASWGRRRVRALGIRCCSRSHLAAVRASWIRRRERVPQIRRHARLSGVGA